jgi:hypothetical protein
MHHIGRVARFLADAWILGRSGDPSETYGYPMAPIMLLWGIACVCFLFSLRVLEQRERPHIQMITNENWMPPAQVPASGIFPTLCQT